MSDTGSKEDRSFHNNANTRGQEECKTTSLDNQLLSEVYTKHVQGHTANQGAFKEGHRIPLRTTSGERPQ